MLLGMGGGVVSGEEYDQNSLGKILKELIKYIIRKISHFNDLQSKFKYKN